jgi:CheY-like chemotaxis protein
MTALQRQSSDPSVPRQAAGFKPHVLVVEDHEDTRYLLTCQLGLMGCRVSVAVDGEDAMRVAKSDRPDLILMDATLPRLDGLAATRRIRETPALRDVPVIFLSGHAEASFRAAALETGGNDFITKPFEISQLGKMLERHLGCCGEVKTR